jgi:ubiquitin-protein ligase
VRSKVISLISADIMNDRLNDYCNVVLENDNIFEWSVYFLGPKGTDYEGVRAPMQFRWH